jgi:hypothetical protein
MVEASNVRDLHADNSLRKPNANIGFGLFHGVPWYASCGFWHLVRLVVYVQPLYRRQRAERVHVRVFEQLWDAERELGHM